MTENDVQVEKLNVLLNVTRDRDAALIKERLGRDNEVVYPDTLNPGQVDLCIVDRASWETFKRKLELIREAQNPLIVPVMLLAGKTHPKNPDASILEEVDEIIQMPIPAEIFQLRLRSLRRMRLDSLQLYNKTQQLTQFRKAMDAANSGIVLTDYRQSDNPVVYVNKAFTKITGYAEEEVIGSNCRFLQGEDRDQDEINEVRDKIEREESCRVVLRNYRKSGELFWNDMKIAPIRNGDGEVTHFIGVQNDITERIRAQREIEEREQQWATLVRQDPDLIMITHGGSGEIQFINPAGARIYGVDDPESMIGKNIFELAEDSPDYPTIQERFQKITSGREVGEYTITLIRNDGERRYVDIRSTLIQYGDGHAVLTVGRDVTDKYKSNERLKNEFHRFRQLFENDPAGIAICQKTGEIIAVNAAFEKIFGYKEEEVVGERIDPLLTSTEQELKEAESISGQHMAGSHQVESVRYDKEGNPIPVIIGGAPVEEDGEVKMLYGIYVDITKQKQLEEENKKLLEQERTLRAKAEKSREKFQEMVQTAPSAICLLEGPEHRFVYVNNSYRELTRKQKYVGKRVDEVFPEIADQGFTELLDWVYESGETYHTESQPIQLLDAETNEWFEAVIDFVYKPMRDTEGNTYGIFVEAIDVTEKVKFRNQLREKLQEKETLLEEIHHRVKNNMAVISGLLYMQLQETDNEEVQRHLEDSLSRIQSMALVHEQLYRQSETESAIYMERYLPKLAQTINETHSIGSRNIEIEVNADEVRLPLTRAVPVGLITAELLINAFKHAFSDRDGGLITIDLCQSNDQFELKVSDNGVGLPVDFSLPANTLGMQIVENLTTQIEGELSFDSTAKQGTTFTVSFPAAIQ